MITSTFLMLNPSSQYLPQREVIQPGRAEKRNHVGDADHIGNYICLQFIKTQHKFTMLTKGLLSEEVKERLSPLAQILCHRSRCEV